jgi:acetoin utilization protein AcuB
MGGNIVSLGTFLGEDPTNRLITVKVADVAEDELVAGMEPLVLKMTDARTCASCR